MDLQEALRVIPIPAAPMSEVRGGMPVAMFRYDFRRYWSLLLGVGTAAVTVTACCALGWEAYLLLKRE